VQSRQQLHSPYRNTAAYDALVGKIDPLAKIISTVNDDLENFNKGFLTTDQAIGKATASTEAQIIKVRQLSKAVLDTTKSENTRKFALQQLKSIDEARFGRYDVEKGKLAGLEGAVISYTRSIIANSVAQKLSDRAGDALIARNSALSLFTAQEKIVNDLIKKYPDLQRQAKKYEDELIRTQGQLGQRAIAAPGVLDFVAATGKLEEYKKQLQDINAVYRQTRTEAIAATEESINLGEALAEATKDKKGGAGTGTKSVFAPQIDSQALDEAFNLDKIIANLTKYGNVLIDVNKTEAERKNALRELSEINPEYFNQFKIGKSSVADAKVKIEDFIRALLAQKKAQEDSLAAAKLNNEFRKNEEKGITDVGDKYRILNDEISSLPQTFKDVEDAYKNANLNIDKIFKPDFSKLDTSFDFDQLSRGFKIIEEQTRQIRDNILSTLSGVQGLLQDTFFELLDEGKTNWKEFGDAAIKEIKRITAALVVKALVEGLANLLTAGTSGTASAVAKGLKSIDTASLGEFLDITPGAANFGGIRGNDGVNMSGQVVMTLRGTDLVGAMNRTNTSINRVG
jgi:hypothetical protein